MPKILEQDIYYIRAEPKNEKPFWGSMLWLPLTSLVLSGVFLFAWINHIAAKSVEPAPALQAYDFDLRVDKTQQPGTFTVGANNLYIINVSRVGTQPVTVQPIIEDILPPNMTVANISATNWDCSTSTITVVSCNHTGELTPDLLGFPPIRVTVNVLSTVQPPVTNVARLTYPVDADPTNNTSSITTNVDSVDLEVAKEVSPSFADISQAITYTMVITNNGPVVANSVVLSDTLSTYLQYTFPPPLPPGVTFSQNGTQAIWNIPSLGVDSTITLTLHAATMATAAGRQIVNTARVSSSNLLDWNTANNTDTVTLAIYTLTNLEVVQFVDHMTAVVGEDITFHIRIINTGGAEATNVRVFDDFADTLDIVSASLNGVPFVQVGNTVDLLVGTLAVGSAATLRVVAQGNSDITGQSLVANNAVVAWGPTNHSAYRVSNIVYVEIFPNPTEPLVLLPLVLK